MGGTTKSKFREAFLASRDSRKKQIVEWVDPKGEKWPIAIIEPTSKQRGEIRRAAMKIKGDQVDFDQTALEVWSVIFCAHDAKTGEPIFDKADYEVLLEVGSANIDKLARPAMKFMGNTPEREAKN